MTLAQQRAEKVPRLSGHDLLDLIGLKRSEEDGSSNVYVQSDVNKCQVLVLDVRPIEDFKRGTLPGSLSLPFKTSFGGDEGLTQDLGQRLDSAKKGKVVCVAGDGGSEDAVNAAAMLLASGYDRLCVLHKGIDIFKPLTGVLCVPDT